MLEASAYSRRTKTTNRYLRPVPFEDQLALPVTDLSISDLKNPSRRGGLAMKRVSTFIYAHGCLQLSVLREYALCTNSAFPGLFPSTYGPDEAWDEWSVNRRCTSAQNQPCILADQIDLAPSIEQTLTHRASQLGGTCCILIGRNVCPTLTLARQRRDETSAVRYKHPT